MDIKIIGVGKIKEQSFKDAINEYLKRLSGYAKVEIVEIEDEKIPKNAKENMELIIKEKEGQKILNKVKESDYVIILDLHDAKSLTSEQFAEHLDKLMTNRVSAITVIIGGSLGLSDNVRKRANYRLELSKMTFTHQFVRLIILEQIYRAFKILNNEIYHK